MSWLRRGPLPLVAAGLLASAFLACCAIVAVGLSDDLARSDAGVVLGSKVEPSGRPSPELRSRLVAALKVWRAGLVRVLIVSGGTGKEGYDEARVMHDWLVARGVPDGAILVDSRGVDTMATARNAAVLMRAHGLTSAMAITQYFHIARTRLALERAGIRPVRHAHADFVYWRDAYSIPREAVGYVVYLVRPVG